MDKRECHTKINRSVVFLFVVIVTTSFAQSSQTESLNKHYLKTNISDTKTILTSPLCWKKSNWLKVSLIVGITAGLYLRDQKIKNWVQENRNDTSNRVSRFARPFGDGKYTLPPLFMFYLYGYFFRNDRAQRTAMLSLESFVVSGIFTSFIKFAGHRHRPSTGDPSNTWDGPSISISNLSFPSGHSCSAFAIAVVIASEYRDIVFVPPLAYGVATLTALSRVNDNAHWTSDVFFGSVIGYFTGKAILNLNSKGNKNFSLLPVIAHRYAGLLLKYELSFGKNGS